MDLLEMGFQASVIILVVIVCRILFLNRLPKKVFLILWSVVLLRLLIPYSFSSILSIYSLAGQSTFIMERAGNIANWGQEKQEQKENTKKTVAEKYNKKTVESTDNITKNTTGKNSFPVWKFVWAAGFIICTSFFTTVYILCCKRFCTSLPVDNAYTKEWLKSHKTIRHLSIRQSEYIKSPLSYGILRPVVLMPEKTNWENLKQVSYILEHEFVHVRRFDTVIKLFLIIAASVHWFNPLVWIMYIFVNRDIELACDEEVIRHFGEDSKTAYALMLIGMEEEKSGIVPLGSNFSKNTAEERITAIMKIKKSSIAAHIKAFILVAIVVVVFATSAESAGKKQESFSAEKVGNVVNKDIREKDTDIEEENYDIQEDTYTNVLGGIAAGIAAKGDYDVLRDLAPFVKQEDMDKIAKQIAEKEDYNEIINLVPFLSKDAIHEIEKYITGKGDYNVVIDLVPFL